MLNFNFKSKINSMKKSVLLLVLLFSFTSCYNRIGDLNLVSNRNIDSSQKYVLINRSVEAKAKSKRKDPLEQAIDNAVEKSNGEYMSNVKIYVRSDGKKVKVIGDVFGTPEQLQQSERIKTK